MTDSIGKKEKITQRRVIDLFKNELDYRFLGDWEERDGNSNIEENILTKYLRSSGYEKAQISSAIHKLQLESNNHNRSLYANNQAVYSLLRYGTQVLNEKTRHNDTIMFIDWDNPQKNDFAIAEEVTLKGNNERRPDIVLYINGIAIGVLELKRSKVSLEDGIRQNLSNQQSSFNEWFFTTVQVLFAGNDAEGLKYGTTLTEEKYWLKWKEDEEDNSRFKLDKYLLKICNKERLIEIMHDFILFDGGVKKLPRVHQYFGIKAAQEHIRRREGGIIWHTQGSGKSILMVMLAKWILENNSNARVVVITDRDELDKQIERVFTKAGEKIKRTKNGHDLMKQLGQPTPRLLCSLIHKFRQRDVGNWDEFIEELKAGPKKTFGDLFVFVDECHRTQSGKLHEVMTTLMPNAVFIGFTGTPLLKKDKKTSLEVFGHYIHTYKFSEAVEDNVVLDLLYEARDIDQRISSKGKVDAWFESKTKGLKNKWQKDELKRQWATMQKLMSSRSRMEKVVSDIVFDFSVKPRLSNDKGNATLVVRSIFEACKYYNLFQKTVFKNKCAIVTSYSLDKKDTTLEETGANNETDRQVIFNTYTELVKDIDQKTNMTKTEVYEEEVKKRFIEEPANMKLIIVVEKLLTGFDAPSCTYLYIDKSMQDHGLFQAICRTNRLDGEDKEFGYIIDYKDLFKKVEKAISVYSSEIDHSTGGVDPDVLMKARIDKAKEKLEDAMEAMALIIEPIPQPKGELECIHYFCGNTEIQSNLDETEPKRVSLYKVASQFMRSYANLAEDLEEAGFTVQEVEHIRKELNQAMDLRALIRRASGEELDLKVYEADMRHLIDTYIEASESRKISPFDDVPLIDLIVKSGIADAISKKFGNKKPKNNQAIAEIIENNVRSKIVQEQMNDPAYYEQMSELLDEVIKYRKENADRYEEYLKKVADLAKKVKEGNASTAPKTLKTEGQRALYNNLGKNEVLAIKIDSKVKEVSPADWRGEKTRYYVIKDALYEILKDGDEVERIFKLLENHEEY